nr:MAG: alpha-amylase/alpha-mannosidase [Candidatus Nanosalinarum sp. J07AB56]
MSVDAVLCFEVHQPHRLRRQSLRQDADSLRSKYFDSSLDREIFLDVSRNCYGPVFDRLAQLCTDYPDFSVNLSVSTSWLDQARRYRPDLIDRLHAIPGGSVEFIGQAHRHSLAGLLEDKTEFKRQLRVHRDAVRSEFGAETSVGTNTELLYNDSIGKAFQDEGFDAVLTEGAPRALTGGVNHVAEGAAGIKVLPRNRRLTDDVGYRFSNEDWTEHPLLASQYASWLSSADGDLVTLFMDIETFGEHHWRGTGVLDFLDVLPEEAGNRNVEFITVSDAVSRHPASSGFRAGDMDTVSWADSDMDASAWVGNEMQREVFDRLEGLRQPVLDSGSEELLSVWEKLLTSDHLHHMSTKGSEDGGVHEYFSYFRSPFEAYSAMSEILDHFEQELEAQT